ncbi:hypothetical protein E2562_028689 [Oryza meyeriana var. granulata]|uniref:CASP-like protein n=1 Tax=Oryza meyeriana var. granulata TaxID=110450 RepID=A0A6G1CJJ1_9ORYZ|nr:hypothetical protein E2562_028689 [Oryza meyeriana var. granulata]
MASACALMAMALMSLAFSTAAIWAAAGLAGHDDELRDQATDATCRGDAATALLLLLSVTYFLAVTVVYRELAGGVTVVTDEQRAGHGGARTAADA